jgi:dipeptidyl aminopeptidase/acylaminoacyl peptidase
VNAGATDLRHTELYREAESLYASFRRPGTGQISDAAELSVSPNAREVAFAATVTDQLEGAPPTRIAVTLLASGDTRVLTFGPNTDRSPKYSPDGKHIAFLSDRDRPGDVQLYLLNRETGAARKTPTVEGWVEYLDWSPDGTRILLGVCGYGADLSGGQGAVTSPLEPADRPAWMPTVECAQATNRWRRLWLYDTGSDCARQLPHFDDNVWEAHWCGNESIAAIVSPAPGEGLWYSARLKLVRADTGAQTQLYTPRDQLGCLCASPYGTHLAVIDALCSDRGFVAGVLTLIEVATGQHTHIDTAGVDITGIEWRSDSRLLLAGHRGLETVVGLYDLNSESLTEVWRSTELSTGGFFANVCGIGDTGDCALIGEGFVRAPELAVIRHGEYHAVKSFDLNPTTATKSIESYEPVTWQAPDGRDIQGWLLRPPGTGPYPLIMHLHGGPVWHWRPTWLGRKYAALLMLLERGYAVFLPNPRGSSGRGREFARQVVGDMGGADARDCLAGLDHLTARGIADSQRLGVTGSSYGGYLSAWLITQDSRFAAAVPVAPVTNHVTQHLIGNIPHFVSLFLADSYQNLTGRYYERSPILHVHKARTPTLNICGARDRCTPPEEAVQFHRALWEEGVESVLVTYPQEGHGIRAFPAAIDYAARVVSWFEAHV